MSEEGFRSEHEKPWKDQTEYDLIMASYLMDSMMETQHKNPDMFTEEQIDELSSPAAKDAALSHEMVEFLLNWVERHHIPINLQELIDIGQRNFARIKKNFEQENEDGEMDHPYFS